MKKYRILPILFVHLWSFSQIATAAEGMIDVPSSYSVAESASRLESILIGRGMNIFGVVNHSGNAATAGIDLRATQLLIFGNPAVGSPLMQCSQSVAIDLPQKALVWEDESGSVYISYNDPNYLIKRHDITACNDVIERISDALGNIITNAAQ